MGLDLFISFPSLKALIMILAIIAGVFVIATKNAIISVFNLIVLYILVAFYLIYIGITYLGISYIIVYIGAIAILFLFVIMMIDIEVIEKKNNNYLPLLFFLFGGFLFALKKIFFNLGIVKINSFLFKNNDNLLVEDEKGLLFNINPRSLLNTDKLVSNGKIDSSPWLGHGDDPTSRSLGGRDVDSDYSLLDFSLVDKFLGNNDLLNIVNNNDIFDSYSKHEFNNYLSSYNMNKYDFKNTDFILNDIVPDINSNNYLLIIPEWDSAVSRATQITTIGDVLYTVYHSYIYIVSVILLLGMVGAIILTADDHHTVKIINIEKASKDLKDYSYNDLELIKPKNSNILAPFIILNEILYNYIKTNNNYYKNINVLFFNYILNFFNEYLGLNNIKNLIKLINIQKYKLHVLRISGVGIYPFVDVLNSENHYSEGVVGTLIYFIISNIIIGLLLLIINSTFSLSIKYLEKGGGFECGFTSFVQTRERYNIIFYRVSLLFLIFDLEIILAFPYPALYQKNQSISKNNILAFLYILVVGFIYELKEGALNIVKTPHHTDIHIK